MNRFRTKKKAKEEAFAPRPSQDSESSGFRFRKGKKPQEEPKPEEIDLSSALPSSDDFRTSLLMTGLSARFSMLREQDDPSTKIGKALDDSVLFPKRQSRMQDLGPAGALSALGGLSDIAEVESIRAPFARNDPYASDNESTHGSVMTRAKPTEGNNLFGGRQKVYKVSAGGGMNGRVLYDDDVALSAFQKWKRDEQKRKSLEAANDDGDDGSRRPSMEEPYPRSESPFSSSYNRKRETNSTTSSIPSMARNSTAATSITSQQPTPSVKDWQGGSTAPTSASSTPVLDRTFTRARRLYETGLNNDLQEQQSSAMSKMDTLSRQRNLGARTPDLGQASPSPTTSAFSDRLFGDRRILSKASAPQLRSMSPTSRSGSGTPDLGIRVPSSGDSRNGSFAGTAPLSPPISESEEISALPIGPNDRGKATALGVFQKPAQPYDESRFAQRQLQLQQGRETPTQRSRTESNASQRSGSTPQPLDLKITPTLEEEPSGSTFFDDSDVSPGMPPPQLHVERPADNVHPALRHGALPTPLSLSGRSDGQPSPTAEPSSLSPQPQLTPADSPTLGPGAIAGLSGMVRQHLRADSGASSIYGITSATEDNDRHYANEVNDYRDLVNNTLSWNPQHDSTVPRLNAAADEPVSPSNPGASRESRGADEFARELADGARRVREKLTSYVESDNGSTTNLALPENREPSNAQLSKPAPFGLLRSKTSLGTMAQPPKAGKMLARTPTSPGQIAQPSRDETREVADMSGGNESEGNGEQHAGIRAFRQARRDLQRLKEAEMQQRRPPPQGGLPEPPAGRSTPTNQRNPTHRSPSRDRKPPLPLSQRRPSVDTINVSRSGSRGALSIEHDRSGSDSSRERPGSRPESRQTRSRNGSSPPARLLESNDDRQPMRSPGLPGTNIRRSPHMPPQGFATRTQQQQQQGLRVRPVQDSELGNPSPISPMPSSFIPQSGLPSSPRAFKTPNPGLNPDGSEVPGLNDNMKRTVKKREISEPTFVMSTSRVPTVSLPTEASANRDRGNSRSRSNSRSDNFAPPLPPINPRRRQEGSKTRTIFGSLVGRKSDEGNASAPQLSTGPRPGSANPSDDDVADKPVTRQLRKMASEAQGMQLNRPMGAPNSNNQYANMAPPAARMVVTQNAKDRERTSAVLPGGMI
ncbi:hypothetical protein PG985_000083 [Apiospora marii]|uniref:uncharacterized protein n=1 Tax=Apiospora marii TaxID=335849 RepID=UPI00312EB25C